MSSNEGRPRDKENTKKILVNTVIEILEKEGFSALGINSIAEHANVNKVLIYRYFGGLPGLLKAVTDTLDMTKTGLISLGSQNPGGVPDLGKMFKDGFLSMHEQLKKDNLTIELMIQELSRENELTRSLAEAREEQGLKITEKVGEFLSALPLNSSENKPDLQAVFAAASAAIYYLTLRARTVKMFNGVDIQSREGWNRICDCLAGLIEKSLTDNPPKKK